MFLLIPSVTFIFWDTSLFIWIHDFQICFYLKDLRMDNDILSVISVTRNLVLKEKYAQFEKRSIAYMSFSIFSNRKAIEIDRKENQDFLSVIWLWSMILIRFMQNMKAQVLRN